MRRRDLLQLGIAMPAVLATRVVRAQPTTNTVTRAAVVIGVDKPVSLPPLHAAASGAQKVGAWLKSEGFELQLFTDDQKPVKAEDIFAAIDGFVRLGTLQQLVVYFAGHGCVVGTGEYWLLSQAPYNANQAIGVSVCMPFTRQCGIPNVVLISDACRSTSASLGIQSLNGYNIFPILNNTRVFTYLDTFFAARVGAPAYEVSNTAGKYDGIYTACLLDAYLNPDDSVLEQVDGQKVVPNKQLEKYLLSEVPKRALISDISEYPNSSVTSAGSKYDYIGQARKTITVSNPSLAPESKPKSKVLTVRLTMDDIAEFEWKQIGVPINRNGTSSNFPEAALRKAAEDTGFTASRATLVEARGPDVFKYGTGINVFGTRLRPPVSPNMQTQILREGDGSREPAIVQVDPRGRRQDTVALEFEDGSGTVIAVLQGYVAKVVVEEGKVTSVSYAPAQIGDQLGVSGSHNQRVEELHALVATSAKFGVFRIDGPREIRDRNAEQLANTIRMEKAADPTLGIYAAYAYAGAGLFENVRSVRNILKAERGIDLFDIAMLSQVLSADQSMDAPTPFCPMLNQGWQFLAVSNATLPRQLSGVQEHILPALWTTFDAEGMSIVKAALQYRNLQ